MAALSSFLSPPRYADASPFSLRGGFLRPSTNGASTAWEGAVRSAPLVRSRQPSPNHQLTSNRHRSNNSILHRVFGWTVLAVAELLQAVLRTARMTRQGVPTLSSQTRT